MQEKIYKHRIKDVGMVHCVHMTNLTSAGIKLRHAEVAKYKMKVVWWYIFSKLCVVISERQKLKFLHINNIY